MKAIEVMMQDNVIETEAENNPCIVFRPDIYKEMKKIARKYGITVERVASLALLTEQEIKELLKENK